MGKYRWIVTFLINVVFTRDFYTFRATQLDLKDDLFSPSWSFLMFIYKTGIIGLEPKVVRTFRVGPS